MSGLRVNQALGPQLLVRQLSFSSYLQFQILRRSCHANASGGRSAPLLERWGGRLWKGLKIIALRDVVAGDRRNRCI